MPTVSLNKRASFDYELTDRYEAGLVLTGAEVKSIKTGHISLKGSFVTMHGGELWLLTPISRPIRLPSRQLPTIRRDHASYWSKNLKSSL